MLLSVGAKEYTGNKTPKDVSGVSYSTSVTGLFNKVWVTWCNKALNLERKTLEHAPSSKIELQIKGRSKMEWHFDTETLRHQAKKTFELGKFIKRYVQLEKSKWNGKN